MTKPRREHRHRRTTEEIRGAEEATCAELGRLFHCGQEFFKAGFDGGEIAGHWEGRHTRVPRRKLNVASARAYRRRVFPEQGPKQESEVAAACQGRGSVAVVRESMKAFRAREAAREALG